MKYLRFFLLVLIFFTGIQLGIGQVNDYSERIKSTYNNIFTFLSSGTPGLFIESTDTAKNEKPYSYLWPLCALAQAANELESLYPETEYFSQVLKSIRYYYNPSPPKPGYQAYVSSAGNDTRYIDDNQWIGIACIDAYKRTGKREFLVQSVEIYNFMMSGYDTISGGGLYWREGDKTTKNTCSNGPGIILSLQLFNATKEKKYLDNGIELFNWVNKYLKSPEGIYYDALKVRRMQIDSAKYTYNTGTMLQSYVLLYKITGRIEYLNEAKRIASAAYEFFYRNSKLPDHYWFNAVLMRGFVELSNTDGNFERMKLFIEDSERIWKEQRDANGLLGRHAAKTLIDQAAMVEIFCRLQQIRLAGRL